MPPSPPSAPSGACPGLSRSDPVRRQCLLPGSRGQLVSGSWEFNIPGGGMRNAECGMRNAECGMRNAECGMRNAECGMRNAECGMRNAECGMRVNLSRHPASGIRHPASSISLRYPRKVSFLSGLKRYLVLSDGTVYEGRALGAEGETVGEVVFNTGMTGYQEILTDPSYAGQIVLLTYPLIGNYGINEDDFESDRLQPAGLIVREACETPSNWRSTKTLHQLLEERGMVGIQGLDTRAITKHIRSGGVAMGVVCGDVDQGRAHLAEAQGYDDTDFAYKVSTKAPYKWGRSGKESVEEPDDPERARLVV